MVFKKIIYINDPKRTSAVDESMNNFKGWGQNIKSKKIKHLNYK